MDLLTCEIRFEQDATRESPGRVVGTLLRYETPAGDRPEIFTRGALSWPADGILVNAMHDRSRPVFRAIPFMDGDEIRIDAQLPNSTAGRDSATNIREGVYGGLSVEFAATREGRRGNLREIRQGVLVRAGLVDKPSYRDSTVEVRSDSGLILPRAATLWL